MTGLSDAHHFRKVVAGCCLLAAPLLLLVAMVIHPDTGTSEASLVAAAADSPDAWYVAHLLVLVSLAVAIPAVLGLMHMLRERETSFGHVGGGLALLGILAFTGIVAVEGFAGWQIAKGGDDAALLERLYDSAGFVIPFVLMGFAFMLGMLVLAVGLYRAHAVQAWMALFVAIGAVLMAVAFPTAVEVLAIVGAAFLLVGLGSIGREVLGESDEDWERTPERPGFRPTLGTR